MLSTHREHQHGSTRLAASGMMLILVALALFATWSNIAASNAAATIASANDRLELYFRASVDAGQELSLEREYRVEPFASVLTAHSAAGRDLVATLEHLETTDPAHRALLTRLLAIHRQYADGAKRVFAAVAEGDRALETHLDDTVTDPARRRLESGIDSTTTRQAATTDAAIARLRGSEFALLVATPIVFAFGTLVLALFLRISRRYQQTILLKAARDALTGLPNRECFYDRGVQALLADARRGSETSVLVIDLDRFKELNDTLGHRYGDELLGQIGPRLVPLLRLSDTLARLGGDEFAILLPESGGVDAAREVAERLIAALREPFVFDTFRFTLDASCGFATSPQDGTDIDSLLQYADVAMYLAKAAHSDAVAYNAALDVNTPKRLAILSELPGAIRDGNLVLQYQPKIDLETGTVVGAEALVRWDHPARGLIPPDDFVPAAEHSGLMKPLTSWVLDNAIEQCRHWIDTAGARPEAIPLSVAVNLSARNLLDEHFPQEVSAALSRHRVPPALLALEVTETAIMADPLRARAILLELHDLGVTLSIDDFGTGYSSLSYLKVLPVDELKIDKSFVMHMNDEANDLIIVRSVIDLAHNLGLKTVAEGVESKATLDQLGQLGCDLAQGYHLGRPMSAEAFDAWLAASTGEPAAATR